MVKLQHLFKPGAAVILTTLLIMFGCSNSGTDNPASLNTDSAAATITVSVGKIGQLSKMKTINLKSLVLTLSCPDQDTIHDTTTINGTGGNSLKVTIGNLRAPCTWTVLAKTFDTKDSCVHSGSTTFVSIPADTAKVSLSLDAYYSMLKISFNGIPDIAAKVLLTVNGDSFTAESTFTVGSRDTVVFAYDYLNATKSGVANTVSLKAAGLFYGKDTILYTADTTFDVVSGENKNYNITLKWVGPVDFPPPGVTDIDGNFYPVVTIGNQVWTTVNLRTTRYNDGTPIPLVTDSLEWSNLSTPGYCWYDNSTDTTEQEKWGALYNWYVVNTGKLAPAGWHVPTDAEWTVLKNYLIANKYNWDDSISGNKIGKSLAAKTDWYSSSQEGTVGNDLSSNNSTDFSALPGGKRVNDGNFYEKSFHGLWWSATDSMLYAMYSLLAYNYQTLGGGAGDQEWGLSVRLVRELN
jgi:uncharacterized protein (TIGR02145 family)